MDNTNKRSKKSISLTISVMILIIIALMASILAYNWVTGYTEGSTQTGTAPTPTPTVTVNPQDTSYTLTIQVNPTAGGTITTDKTAPYQSGDVVTLTANAAEGYTFSGWSSDATGTTKITTITMDSNKTVTAIFTQNDQAPETTQYALAVNSPYGTTAGAGLYDAGTTAYATVAPLTVLDTNNPENIQYIFTNWSSDASGTTSPSNAITMDGSKTATANWKTQYKIQVIASPSEGGTPTLTTQWCDAGSTLQISTTVNSDCTFSGWTATEGCVTFTNASALQTTITVNGPGIVYANFVTGYIVNFQGLDTDATGNLVYFDVKGGSYIGATSPISVEGGVILVDNNAIVTYRFADTLDSSVEGKQYKLNGTGSGTVYTSAAISGNYKIQYQVIFAVNPENAGTTTPSVGTNWCDIGALNISATANNSYIFDSWTTTGSVTLDNKALAIINGTGTITANFNVTKVILASDFEGNVWDENWNDWPNPPWFIGTDYARSGSVSAKTDAYSQNVGPITSDKINATGATAIHISFWYKANTPASGITNVSYTGLSNPLTIASPNPDFTGVSGSNLGDTDGQWIQVNLTITDLAAFTDSFRLRIESFLSFYFDTESSSWIAEEVWVDDVVVTAVYA